MTRRCDPSVLPGPISADDTLMVSGEVDVSREVLRHDTPTDMRKAGARWRERLLTALNCAGDAIEMRDLEGRILYVNQAWEELTGYALLDVRGTRATQLDVGDPALAERQRARIAAAVRSGVPWRGELVRRHNFGHEFIQETIVSPVIEREHGEVRCFVAVARDVSTQRDVERQLTHLAKHDALTGLANRTLLLERLAGHLLDIRRGGPSRGALLYFDFDRFKCVNDTLGHQAGDRLLCAVASRVGSETRRGDTFARVGGDEFCVLMPAVADRAEAIAAAERILGTFSQPFELAGPRISTSASVGVVMLDEPCAYAPLAYICDADRAMIAAKRDGGGRVRMYDADLKQEVNAKANLEALVLAAIRRRRFRITYDWVHCCGKRTPVAREARLEVLDPQNRPFDRNLVREIVEQAAVGSQLLRFTFEQVVADHLRRGGWRMRLSIGYGQAVYEGAFELLLGEIRRQGADASRFVVVLTDAPARGSWHEVRPALTRLVERGVRLELDGFAGVAGVESLGDLPLRSVLVREDYVTKAVGDRAAMRLVGGLCGLARSMGLLVGARLPNADERSLRQLRASGVDFFVETSDNSERSERANESLRHPTVPLRASLLHELRHASCSSPSERPTEPRVRRVPDDEGLVTGVHRLPSLGAPAGRSGDGTA